ncbi:MAG: P-II family nitrogen regulator [Bacteroidales bacterium]|nr:P-II family nitrogen regulator [Bacteroidales bacterium]
MKLIKVYIRHRMFDKVYQALRNAGYCCMTIVECEGTGMYSDHEKEHISSKYPSADAYRVIKLEILTEENEVFKIVQLIRHSGRTGYSGDGMIIVSPAENAYKIRTNEEGFNSI